MNILMIGVDASKYGSPMSMAVLARELTEAGHKVVCVIPKKGAIEEVLQEYAIPYRIIGIKKWIAESQKPLTHVAMKCFRMCVNFISEIRLVFLCKRFNIEIVHLNTSASACGYFCSKMLQLKLVWHIREFGEEDFGQTFYNRKKALKRISNADAVITISRALQDKYKAEIPNDKLHVIYNGIDEKVYGNAGSIFTKSKVVVAHIGRFHQNKGQAELLEACLQYEKVHGKIPFEVWIVGESEVEHAYTAYLKSKAEEIQGEVCFKGFSDNVAELLSQVDIVVANAKCEAFGRVTVEAMMSGRLVIGTQSGGTPEIVGDCGLLYEYGNAAALSEKIFYALEHKEEMAQTAERGRERALSQFTAKHNAKEVNELYYELKDERK